MIGLVLLMIAATTDSLGDRSDHQPIYNPASATSGTRKENLIFRLKLPRELHERILAELLYLETKFAAPRLLPASPEAININVPAIRLVPVSGTCCGRAKPPR